MATWLVDKMMDKIIDSCFEYLQGRIGSQPSVEEELDRLRGYRDKIKDVVSASNQAQIGDCNEALDEWMQRLRDAIDDANDLLEEFEYLELKEQLVTPNVEKSEKNKRSFIHWFVELPLKILKVGDGVLKDDPNLKRLTEVVQNLEKVTAEVSNFFEILKYTEEKGQQPTSDDRERGSFPGPVFKGRGREKANIMKWLRKPLNQDPSDTDLYNNISLLSIVGHGGMGKTTLLQHVFEDVKEEFDLKIWVCVSNNFKEEEVITDILKYLNKWKPHLTKLPPLQNTLKFVMQSKKFLLVLDDVWEENTTKWGNVLFPLAKGSLGGKILVTTRMESIASMFAEVIRKKKKMFRLKGLRHDECLQLLKAHAFGVKENSSRVHKELECIAEEIVKKLSGCPLAAKVIGGVLKSELTPEHWERVLKGNMESLTSQPGQNKSTIIAALRLSYSTLPEPLKNCFAFCGIFPQGHQFDKDDLVRMWIALDFIQPPSNPGETMEDMGRWYFDTLVKISFFDKINSTFYTMHDLIHVLARHVSKKKCFRFVVNKDLSFDIPETIRHLFVEITNLDMLREITKLTHLRSLFLTYRECQDQNFMDVLAKVFKALRSVRVLFMSFPYLKLVPESIENLIHLRYLNFYRTPITLLPKALCNLYHLQFFIFNSVSEREFSDDFIPEDMKNISNLRYLKLPQNLKSLQKLDGFYVWTTNGYKIWELKHSNDFCRIQPRRRFKPYFEGALSYYCAESDYKEDLTYFPLDWGDDDKFDCKENLTYLSLDWGDNDRINEENLTYLPLDLGDYDRIDKERSGTIEWGFYERTDEESGTFTNFQHLLTNLQIERKSRTSRKMEPDSDSGSEVVILEKLEPPNNIKELLKDVHMGAGSTLWLNKDNSIFNVEYIRLDKCLNWEILPPFGQLPRLKYLYLLNMPKIEVLDNKFHQDSKVCTLPSLELLHIENLQVLEVWFDVEAAKDNFLFPCLNKLYLKDCPKLQELSCLPPKLQRLELNNITWKSFDFLKENNSCCNIRIRNLGNLKYFSRDMASNYKLEVSAEVINDPSVLMMEPLRSTESINLLRIKDCPMISFPYEAELWFQKVSYLRQLNLERLQNLDSLPYFSSLEILHMIDVPELQNLLYIPVSLKQLRLENLESLQDLPSFRDLSSLEVLDIIDVPKLQRLLYIPASLYCLNIVNLKSLQDLPAFSDVSSLKILKMINVPELQRLPYIPTYLKTLHLENLKSLQDLLFFRDVSSLEILRMINVPELRRLPYIPASLKTLHLENLKSFQDLLFFRDVSSLEILQMINVPELQRMPYIPASLKKLYLENFKSLEDLPSFRDVSSLEILEMINVPKLQRLLYIPASLKYLNLQNLQTLQDLPSFRGVSSLEILHVIGAPNLQQLPNLPASLKELKLERLNSLQSLPSFRNVSSLESLNVEEVPLLQLLPEIPASLKTLWLEYLESLRWLPISLPYSSLEFLHIKMVPQLQLLPPKIPTTLRRLELENLESLQCLPCSLLDVSSLEYLSLESIPLLISLPDLPPSLSDLFLNKLDHLDCLPSCLSNLYSLTYIDISEVSELRELPDLPPSLETLSIRGCHPELLERYKKFSGSNGWIVE